MKKCIIFILNLPWTLIGLVIVIISIPYRFTLNKEPTAFIFRVYSFWYCEWLPYFRGVRGMALGNVILLGRREQDKDLEHELIHVEQSEREPFIHIFLYQMESFRMGYRGNKYEEEAYNRAGNRYIK